MAGLNWIPISLYKKNLKRIISIQQHTNSKNNDNKRQHNSRVKDEFEDTKG